MRRVVLFVVLALTMSSVALADSISDYVGFGSSTKGTATISTLTPSAGGTLMTTTALTAINGVNASGTITWDTGTLVASGSGFTYSGGTLTITSGTSTLFTGTFSNGTVSASSTSVLVTGFLPNGGGTETVTIKKNGAFAVSADIGLVVATPEPGTLGLLGTGLVGLAGVVRRKLRA